MVHHWFRGEIIFNAARLTDFLRPILALRGDERVLDLGCGIGVLSKIMSTICDSGAVIGIDLGKDLVEYGNKTYLKGVENAYLQVGDANKLAYPARMFDVVTGFGLFEHVSDTYRVLAEAVRVLRPPGLILIVMNDLRKFYEEPRVPFYKDFVQDINEGRRRVGVDVDRTRLMLACEELDLQLEDFEFVLENQAQITEETIAFMQQQMAKQEPSKSMFREVVEYYYYFLKEVGWSLIDVKKFFTEKMSASGLTDFYQGNLGKVLVRRNYLIVSRIQVS